MTFERYLNSRRAIIEKSLEAYFPQKSMPLKLTEAVRYSLLDSGKRVRPVLMLAVADIFGTPYEKVLPFACAIEMIHTYTLIHDDLPAMDNDDFRRGKPTSHKVFGEAMAILAGDTLLTDAFRIMTEGAIAHKIQPSKALAALYEIAFHCGMHGVVGGQVMDVLTENKKIDFATLQYIHTHKTGALILASIRVGAILSKSTRRDMERLSRYGERVGLAFQIMDDILDVEGDFKKLGKTVGADQNRKKNTYPSLVGMKQSKEIFCELMSDAEKAIAPYGKRADMLKKFAIFLRNRQS